MQECPVRILQIQELPGSSPDRAWIFAGKQVLDHSALRNAVCLRTEAEVRRFN